METHKEEEHYAQLELSRGNVEVGPCWWFDLVVKKPE